MRTYGFVFADEMEYKPFLEYALAHGGEEIKNPTHDIVELVIENARILGIRSGIGKVYAATAAAVLIERYEVDSVLSAGLSGAISHLHKGDVVAGSSYVECDFDLTAFGRAPGEKSDGVRAIPACPGLLKTALSIDGVQEGALGTGDFFLTDPETKHAYKEEFGIQAFDMETAALAAVCQKLETPFLSVRKISDDADDNALDSYTQLNDLAEMDLSLVLLEIVNRVENF